MSPMRSFVLVTLSAAFAGAGLAAQDLPETNPFEGDSAAILAGMGQFRQRCADCHGTDARGVRGPDITQVWSSGRTDRGLFQTIRRGVSNTEMPAFAAPRTSDRDVWQMLAYLRTLAAPAPTEPPTGNAENGAVVFESQCAGCHRVNAEGGRLGPDLSRIGASRSREVLVARLRTGVDGPRPGFQPVTITPESGPAIRGVKKNEDLFSVQIMDTRERIQGYEKDKVRSVVDGTRSLMPVFGPERLSDADLNDLVRYLGTLRGYDPSVPPRPPSYSEELMTVSTKTLFALALLLAAPNGLLAAQEEAPPPLVTTQEILEGLPADGSRWLTFGGDYANQRHSPLTQITPENVGRLQPRWTFQTGTLGNFETTSLLRDNVLYVTGPQNVAWAIDARTGRQIWRYRRELPSDLTACCGLVNRGFAILGDKLFMVTLDAHVLALDARTGSVVWDAELEEHSIGYAATIAPLVVGNKVIVGVAGGEYGIRGFIDAYDAESGERVWRFYTVPAPGEPGNDTWGGDSWRTGGASVWVTGAYDPEQNLVLYGIGNPGPDYHSESRPGDNLYSNSLVALDADTGRLRWHYQFTPHDVHDWDATEVPILADLPIAGQTRKVVMFANRNGFFYTLDRTTGEVLVAKPFVRTTWATEIGADGRPVLLPGHVPNEMGSVTCPDLTGGTNFWQPSFDPSTRTFFVNAREVCMTYFAWEPEYRPGERFTGGAGQRVVSDENPAYGALRAIDPVSGERKWEFKFLSPSTAGLLTTASGLLFAGDPDGNLLALDSRNGQVLWRYQMGAPLHGTSPTTYMVDGKQHLLVPAGTTLTAWALP